MRNLVFIVLLTVSTFASATTFYQYSAQGSVLDAQNNLLNVSGIVRMDGTLRNWVPPHEPSVLPTVDGTGGLHVFFIDSFAFHIGNLNFYSFGQLAGPESSWLMFGTSLRNGTWTYSAPDWRLEGSGDLTMLHGFEHTYFNSDGTKSSVEQIFQEPPPTIRLWGWCCTEPVGLLHGFEVTLNLVSPVPPIPEPEVYAMMAMGMGFLGFVARRKTKKKLPRERAIVG